MNYGAIDNPDGSKIAVITSEGVKIRIEGQTPQPVAEDDHATNKVIAELEANTIQSEQLPQT